MQEYLQKTRLSAVMDRLGGTALLFAGSMLLFVMLWGLHLTAIAAGIATFGLCMMMGRRTRAHRLQVREERLRQRIGGEMKLEAWTVEQPRRAHFETALLLSTVYPLTLLRTYAEGVACEMNGEQLLIICAQAHASDQATARDVAAIQRLCGRKKAARAVLCGMSGQTAEAQQQAEISPQVRFISREQMISLAGAAWPATDRDLVALGKRKRARHRPMQWRRRMLDARRAPNYLMYGLLLLGMYLITGHAVYPLPGLACLLLMALCRVAGEKGHSQRPEL